MMAVTSRQIFMIALVISSAALTGGVFAQTKTPGNGAMSQGAGAQFAASNRTATLDCAGGKAQIAGSNNKLTLTGNCTGLEMLGSGNTVTVALAKSAGIQFVGSNNAITWTTPDGSEPATQQLGSNNTLTRGH